MSTPSLAQLTYEQAQKALEQQERQVNELRQRTGTLLGAAALTASFFGAAALGRDGVAAPVVLAGIALAATVLSGLYVLYPHAMEFAADARRLYDALEPDQDDPERLHLRLAFGLRDTREENVVAWTGWRAALRLPRSRSSYRSPAGRGRSRYCEALMTKDSGPTPQPQPTPAAPPSQNIPPVPRWVFIPENRGANAAPRQS